MMNKTKKTFQWIKAIPVLAILSMLMATTAMAHGPEEHITNNLCSANALAYWNTSNCSATSPADISGGITLGQYPHGLCYPSFNNYTNYTYEDRGTGNVLDYSPYGTDNPALFADERNFFTAALEDGNNDTDWSDYDDELEVKDGDRVQFLVYVHNDGDPCLNEDIPKSGKAASYNTTSNGTKLNVDNLLLGKTELNGSKTLTASIWSDNAFNEKGVKGGKTQDSVKLKTKNGEKLELEYLENSAIFVDTQDKAPYVWWTDNHKIANALPMFSTSGLPLSTHDVGETFKANGGKFLASKPYISMVRFEMVVKKPTPSVCQDLNLTEPYQLTDAELVKFTGTKNNGPMYKLAIKNLKFSEFPLPAQTKIKFTSTDQNGKFWVADYFGGIGSLGKNSHEVYANQFLKDSLNNQIFYTGEGKVTATITGLPAAQANVSGCTDFVVFEKAEEKVCKAILIDHPKTIYKDTVSTFNASVLDQHDEKLIGYVEYSVDYGYGIFMTKYPVGISPNTSGYVYETDKAAPITGYIIDTVLGDPEITSSGTGNNDKGNTGTPKKPVPDPTLGGFNGDINFGLLSVFDLPVIPKNLKDIAVPKKMGDPTDATFEASKLNIKPLDLSITKTTPGGVIFIPDYDGYAVDAVDPEAEAKKPKLDVNNLSIEPLVDADSTKSYTDEIQKTLADKYKNLSDAPKYQTITVPQGTPVFFLALKKGTNVVHVKAINGDGNPKCAKDYSIEEKPKEKIVNKCQDLKVNHQTTILDKTISYFSAKATDPVNGVFHGKITYSVDPGYGTFHTQKPAGDDNPSLPAPAEYTGKFEKPEAGFCEDKVAASNFLAKTFGKAAVTDTKFKNLTDVQGIPAQSGNSITVNPGQVVYFVADLKGKDGKSKVHVEANCTNVAACKRDFDIISLDKNVCSELKISDNPGTIKVGESKEFSLKGKDTLGKDLPANTKVVWTTNTDGKIEKAKGTVSQSVKFTDSKKDGSVTVGIDPTDSLYTARGCKDVVLVKKERIPPPTPETVCRDLDTTLTKKYPTDIKVSTLHTGEIYTISGKPAFTDPTPTSQIEYEINPDIGTFIQIGKPSPIIKQAIFESLKLLKGTGNLTKAKLATISPITTKVTLSPSQEVYLVIYSDAQQTGRNTLSSKVVNYTNPECADTFPIEIAPKECVNLMVEPVHNTFDPKEKYSMLKLTGNYADHNGAVDVSTNCGTLAKTGGITYSPKITFTKDEVKKSGNTLTFVFKGDTSCEGVTISAKGVGTATGKCEDTLSKYKPGDEFKCVELNIKTPSYPWIIGEHGSNSQLFQVKAKTSPAGLENELDYVWTAENAGSWQYGNKTGVGINKLNEVRDKTKVTVYALKDGIRQDNCYDSIKVKSEEEPQIRKSVYPLGEYKKITDFILNISSPKYLKNDKNTYLTYKIEFDNGSEREVELREKELKGGALKGLEGYGGELKYKGMRINVYDGGNKHYTVLKTDGYTDDADDNPFEENRNSDKIERYENDYKCDSGAFTKASTKVVPEPRVCIEGQFEAARANFLDGLPIKFKNLKNTTQIIIKIQMKNETVIDEALCKTLTTTKGCGETFRNTASFKTDKYTGKDDAKVIVICPYILTRQGGDTFFHDVIESGVDVAKCSNVKSSTGTAITPKTGQTLDIASSGAGDIPEEVKLLLPSHNVCRFSNTTGNLEGYNDVLTNFSSTICEMRADVAESWKEANIVTAIKNNITRIARFGTNLSGNTPITEISQLDGTTNAQSGVFIQEGGVLTISLDTPLGKTDKIPAAQTYIVKNGTLKITSNVKYEPLSPTDFLNPSKIPSAAFIVIDGNIEIDPSVTHIDGILMAVDTTGTGDQGKILNAGDASSEKILTISGNLIGDVVDLFKERIGIGDPEKDEGSVTIKYDERILLNTPPGISELIDLRQSIVPN